MVLLFFSMAQTHFFLARGGYYGPMAPLNMPLLITSCFTASCALFIAQSSNNRTNELFCLQFDLFSDRVFSTTEPTN